MCFSYDTSADRFEGTTVTVTSILPATPPQTIVVTFTAPGTTVYESTTVTDELTCTSTSTLVRACFSRIEINPMVDSHPVPIVDFTAGPNHCVHYGDCRGDQLRYAYADPDGIDGLCDFIRNTDNSDH